MVTKSSQRKQPSVFRRVSRDAFGFEVLLYDSQSGKVSIPDVSRAIQRNLEKRCVLSYAIVGFDTQNRVRLRVQDRLDETGERESQAGYMTHCP
jgi:hypothetical protein